MDEAETARKMEKLNRNLAKANPTQRAGQPIDIAQVALFLASDAAGYVNFQDIAVDGGMTAGAGIVVRFQSRLNHSLALHETSATPLAITYPCHLNHHPPDPLLLSYG
ncbi:SDR family oxidoreductase [Alteromonas antoniana]|uniref:SDR family oxidoreductase n=1 Tax=Alteromonas antoniana TaxID=2803813 RepID=UPI001C4725F3|nr:SDR family oxidoreductase [Alteromonas antoniana]